jgi:ABC-type uncharacterized transport system permease subunit
MNSVYATLVLIHYSLLRHVSVPLNHHQAMSIQISKTVILTTDPLLFGLTTFSVMRYRFNAIVIWIFLCCKIVKLCWDVG